MTRNQRKIISCLKKSLNLNGKEVILDYDENSVVIIDNFQNLTLILHFIYIDNKIKLINNKPRAIYY